MMKESYGESGFLQGRLCICCIHPSLNSDSVPVPASPSPNHNMMLLPSCFTIVMVVADDEQCLVFTRDLTWISAQIVTFCGVGTVKDFTSHNALSTVRYPPM